jgi:hypothetical protein
VITGKDFGFEPEGPVDRAKKVKVWRSGGREGEAFLAGT